MQKNQKSDAQIQEELSFIASIKNSVSDWEFRKSEIHRLYIQSMNLKQKISWVSLVESQRPEHINMGDWRRFIVLLKSHKQTKTLKKEPIFLGQVKEKKDQAVQLSLFQSNFKTSQF